jgi:predicted small secreted protein
MKKFILGATLSAGIAVIPTCSIMHAADVHAVTLGAVGVYAALTSITALFAAAWLYKGE